MLGCPHVLETGCETGCGGGEKVRRMAAVSPGEYKSALMHIRTGFFFFFSFPPSPSYRSIPDSSVRQEKAVSRQSLCGAPKSHTARPPASSFSPLYTPTIPTNLAPVGFSSKASAMRLLPATCCAARSCTIAYAGPHCVKPGKLHHTRLGHI